MDTETDNPEKGQLLQRSAHHREILEEEVKLITERSEKILTNALVIGGALALAYFLVSSASGIKTRKKSRAKKIKAMTTGPDEAVSEMDAANSEPVEAGIVSQIGSVLVAQATGFLLSVAREKLLEFLQSQVVKSQVVKKEQTNGNS